MDQSINRLVNLFSLSPNTVVVTGAGISTEAGIPDFRGPQGIYRRLGENEVLKILNINTFWDQPEVFYRFYRDHFIIPPPEPGKAHRVLAQMEEKGAIQAIVTQNVDGLHQKAGSKKVFPIHGNGDRFICTRPYCFSTYTLEDVLDDPGPVPYCSQCQSILKPDVVLFGEQIHYYMDAQEYIQQAKLLLVIGSSLTVYPLAGFVKGFNSLLQDLVIINRGPTAMDHAALIKIDPPHTGDLLEQVCRALQG